MDIDYTDITYLKDPDANTLHGDYQQFLLSLFGLTVIDISGKNSQQWRVITTLVHGNEPSGVIALHRWLTENDQPATNIRIILCSVEAASTSPVFSQRYLAGSDDLTKYFNGRTNSKIAGLKERAALITEKINEVTPQAVIDIHNSAGCGPAFSFSTVLTPDTLTIASFFCDTIVMANLKKGAIMESNFNCPTLEIECGGSHDEQSHEVAYQGIKQFIECDDISLFDQQKTVNIIYKPLKMKLKENVELNYGQHDEGEDGVTLKSSIEQFNFGSADTGQMLGWVDNNGLDNFELMNEQNENVIEKYFSLRDNQLVVAQPMKIFMATTNQHAAVNDCLFYLVKK